VSGPTRFAHEFSGPKIEAGALVRRSLGCTGGVQDAPFCAIESSVDGKWCTWKFSDLRQNWAKNAIFAWLSMSINRFSLQTKPDLTYLLHHSSRRFHLDLNFFWA
jgi:hypothetical protein